MRSSPIAPSRPAATQRADAAPAAGSDADFGPILQAAAAAPKQPAAPVSAPPSAARQPAAPAAQPPAKRAPGNAQKQESRQDGAQPQQAPPAAASRSGESNAASASPQDAHAASAGAAGPSADSPSAAGQGADAQAGDAPRAVGCSTFDPTGIAGGAPVPQQAAPDPTGALAQAAAAATLIASPAARAGAAAAQLAPGQDATAAIGRTSTETLRSAPILKDPGTGTAGQGGAAQADASAEPSVGTTAGTATATSAAAAQSMQTIAQALAGAAQQESSAKPADGATPRPGPDAAPTAALVALPDPANAAAAVSAGGAAGLPAYAPDGHTHVPTPVGQPGFAQDFSDKVLVLARGGVQTAQISLDPAGLGPVGVSIQLHGHEATLAFTAAHEATRNALEEALPRLREMFASSGIQLSDATVGGRSQQDWSAPARSQGSGWQGGGTSDSVPPASAEPGESAAAARAAALRLVDIYA